MTDPSSPDPKPDPSPDAGPEAAQPDAPGARDVVEPDAAEGQRDARVAREAEAERRRRRDRVFGAVLDDTTSDERGHGSPEDGSRDAELRRNVPPHHG